MTLHIVSKDSELNTLNKAANIVAPGDIVEVHDGVYQEMVALDTPDVTWRAAEGHMPVVDGGWNGLTDTQGFSGVFSIPANGVELRGFKIINAPSRGVSTSADDVKIVGNRIDYCHGAGIIANGGDAQGMKNLLVEGNVISRSGYERVVNKGPHGSSSMGLIWVMDSIIRNNVIVGGLGEGMDCGKGSHRVLITGNIIHTTSHLAYYLNRCVECTLDGNIAYHTLAPSPVPPYDTIAAGIVIGDERSGSPAFPWSNGNTIINNLVVAYGKLFQVRNNLKDPGGYDTQLLNTLIANNTFVAGKMTTDGIDIVENKRGRAHANSVFCDNIIDAPGLDPSGAYTPPGVEFHHNAWSIAPPANMRGEGDLYGDPQLTNPYAPIDGGWSEPVTDFDVDNYAPAAGSPVIGAGSDGGDMGSSLAGPVIEPPGGDLETLDEVMERLTLAAEETSRVIDDLKAILENIKTIQEQMKESK